MRSTRAGCLFALALVTLPMIGSAGANSAAAPPAESHEGSPGKLTITALGATSVTVDPLVIEAIRSTGRARVNIVLKGSRPLDPDATPAQERAHDAEIARAHRDLRRTLPPRGVSVLRSHAHAFGAVAEIDASGLEALAKNPRVEWIYLDREVRESLAEGVPLIKANVLHSGGNTGVGQTIAILDTGIDWTHPALGGCFGAGCRVVAGYDFFNNDSDPMDDGGHGTSVAGIAAANGSGLTGTAPGAKLTALKVLDAGGVGSFSAVDAALDWVLTNRVTYGITVANLSLGDSGQYDDPNEPLCASSTTASLIQSLVNAGVAVTIATGNNGYDFGVSFPACVPAATAVAAVYDADLGSVTWCVDKLCNAILCIDSTTGADVFICRNNAGSLLDLLAPSWKATTAKMGGGTRDLGGTSAAAPYAAGAFALMFNAKPGSSVASVEGNLKASGVSVVHPATGNHYRRIDLQAAVANFDPDVDFVPTASDNCPAAYNPTQSNVDGDSRGDACDNCPTVSNSTQANPDGDPAGAACDCDESRANVYPGAPEVCDGVNNNCSSPTYPSLSVEIDNDSDTWAECAGDCDDANPSRNPGMFELCDGVDNDCTGGVPADELDADLDGVRTCAGDCDDAHATVKPGAPEICDGLDNDCDFIIPTLEADNDRDGYFLCSGDCDDTRRAVHPGAPEICDGLDDDCNATTPSNEIDQDSDGVRLCAGDCNDDDSAVRPAGIEICDGRNNDCSSPSWPSLNVEVDNDADGLSECAGDCNDASASVRPGKPDTCNDVDDDCDGKIDPSYPYIAVVPSLAVSKDSGGSDFDHFGSSIAPAADLTGDAVPDFLVGAPGYPAGLQDRGSVLLVSGATRAVVRRMTHPGGSSGAQLGSSVAAASDLDGDGKAEILAGAPQHVSGSGGQSGQGRVVLFSGATGAVVWTYDDPSLPSGANLGATVATLGDLNGDGVAEIVAGAPGDCAGGFGCSGSVWILDGNTGQQLGFVADLSDEPLERFGTAVSAVGDLNGDGKEDFAGGAPNRDSAGFFNSGAVFTFSGATGALLAVLEDPAPSPRDLLGSSLAAIGDLDGDGRKDLVVGAPGHRVSGSFDVGQVLLLSSSTGALIRRLSDPTSVPGDKFGASVASIGDIDRDGVPDVLVGAPYHDEPSAPDAGQVVLFSGRTGVLLKRIVHTLPDEGDRLGSSVAALPPLDGDGLPEIAAGAPLDDETSGEDAGTVDIFSPHVVGDCDGDGIANSIDTCTDADLDGYGSAVFGTPSCPADCDDDRASIHPGAPEVCDGRDSDCNGNIPSNEADADVDGFPICAGDCDDTRSYVRPGAPQVCDGVNNNCTDPNWPTVSPNECFQVDGLTVSIVSGFVRLDWTVPSGGANSYRVYRGGGLDLQSGRNGGFCWTTVTTNFSVFSDSGAPGELTYYLIAGVRSGLEGSRGTTGAGLEREHANVCP